MSRILITSGPTRQYLDPVRYITNASSGRMGAALATAVLTAKHEVLIVSGPVEVEYPDGAKVISVTSTEEMLEICRKEFPNCDGVIGVAAPCDYRPVRVEPHKIHKTGEPLVLHLVETPDVVATLGASKRPNQWAVGFALETEDQRFRAITKMQKKSCDMMVLNGPDAMNATTNQVEIFNRHGEVIGQFHGSKTDVAQNIFNVIQRELMQRK